MAQHGSRSFLPYPYRPFADRAEAGRALAKHLEAYAHRDDVLALALPRGGVPVAFEVSRALGVDMDIFLVRKLGTPGMEELAMGAIASGGAVVLNPDIIEELRIPEAAIAQVRDHEAVEIARRERAYRGDQPPRVLQGHTVILIDDGLATGASMLAAVQAVRQHKPARIVVAVPVAARTACEDLRQYADEVVCALEPEHMYAVGMWYRDFSQVTDNEVKTLLRLAGRYNTEKRNGGAQAA